MGAQDLKVLRRTTLEYLLTTQLGRARNVAKKVHYVMVLCCQQSLRAHKFYIEAQANEIGNENEMKNKQTNKQTKIKLQEHSGCCAVFNRKTEKKRKEKYRQAQKARWR